MIDANGQTTRPYGKLMFAVTSDGYLLALDPSQPSSPAQPIFAGGQQFVSTGVSQASGIAFSTLDFNLWHLTANRTADDGHDINTTYDQSRITATNYPVQGGDSFWFSLETPGGVSTQPGALNYQATSPGTYNTYNLPGGAYGSLSTQTFDLSSYTAADAPMLYFDYLLDASGPFDFDSARVFASADGVNWTNLLAADPTTTTDPILQEGNLANTNGQWIQERISLAAFAGQSKVSLRFDFTTAGTMDVGNPDTTGTYLEALSGEKLNDGDVFQIDGTAYEFDMGVALELPNVAGDVLAAEDAAGTPEWFQIGTTTYEFDADGSVTSGNTAIPIAAGETTSQVAEQIAEIVGDDADPYQSRVMLNGVTSVVQSPIHAITLKGNGSGINGGGTLVPISSTSTASQVAQAIIAAVDPSMSAAGAMIHVVGHTVINPGPLSTGQSLAGDNPQNPTYGTDDRFLFTKFDGLTIYSRAADNAHEGFYLDNVMIGLAERGQMATQAPANTTAFMYTPAPPAEIQSDGYYELQIRRAADYALWPNPDTQALTLTRTIDTNERLNDSFSLTIPPATDIVQGQEFTISDGTKSVTFQFLDQTATIQDVVDPADVPIYFSANQSGQQVAASVAAAINNVNMSGALGVSAATNGASAYVSLFGAAQVTGLLSDLYGVTRVTIPSPVDITNGSIIRANDGTADLAAQLVDPAINVSTRGVIPIYYSTGPNPFGAPYTAADIAAAIVDTINQCGPFA